jgi:uncharacterized damage-inducible protein DinB
MKNLCVRLFVVLALILGAGVTRAIAQSSALSDNSVAGDYRAALLADVDDMAQKFVDLAQAFPADKYTWRPGEGVRSVSEVFLHVSGGAFNLPRSFGAAPPANFTMDGYETSTTDKAKIVDQLKQGFAYLEAAVKNVSDADLQKQVKLYGRDSTGFGVAYHLTNDMHEHLGQAIAYARVNNIVPPWTAARQSQQAQRPPQ